MIQLTGFSISILNGKVETLRKYTFKRLKLMFKNEQEIESFISDRQKAFQDGSERVVFNQRTREK